MATKKLQDQSGDELIVDLLTKQHGKGYGAEGTCKAGNFLYAIVYFNVPMKSLPTITLSSVQYSNCENAVLWKSSEFAFAVRADVIEDGNATIAFAWDAEV